MIFSNDGKSTEIWLPYRRSQVGFNEFEPSCADMVATAEADAASLGLSGVRGTGAAWLEAAEVEMSAGRRGSAGVQTKYFKSASEEKRGVYVTTGYHIILINTAADGENPANNNT